MKQISRLRNVYGDPKKEKFTDVLMAEVTSDGSLLAVNSSFLAVSWQGVGGCVGVFDANTPTRISTEIPLIRATDPTLVTLSSVPSVPTFLRLVPTTPLSNYGKFPRTD